MPAAASKRPLAPLGRGRFGSIGPRVARSPGCRIVLPRALPRRGAPSGSAQVRPRSPWREPRRILTGFPCARAPRERRREHDHRASGDEGRRMRRASPRSDPLLDPARARQPGRAVTAEGRCERNHRRRAVRTLARITSASAVLLIEASGAAPASVTRVAALSSVPRASLASLATTRSHFFDASFPRAYSASLALPLFVSRARSRRGWAASSSGAGAAPRRSQRADRDSAPSASDAFSPSFFTFVALVSAGR